MIYYDGIIENLQKTGGVSVVFKEIISRLPPGTLYKYAYFGTGTTKLANIGKSIKLNPRIFERYRYSPIVARDATVFHSTYYRLPSINIPTVTTVHDFTYEYFTSGLKKVVHCQQKYNAIKNSDKIICVSENTANDLMKFCPVHEDKIVVVNNGVSDSFFPIKQIKKTPSILFVGSRASYKNFDLVVKALEKIAHISLRIVGGGELSKRELHLLENTIPNRYEKMGYLSEQDLNELYNSSLALVYPSSYEGFGIPILEAMKAGCPVVTSNRSSIPEVCGNAGVVLEDLTPGSIEEALKLLDVNFSFVQEQIALGKERSNAFSWDKSSKLTNQVYKSI